MIHSVVPCSYKMTIMVYLSLSDHAFWTKIETLHSAFKNTHLDSQIVIISKYINLTFIMEVE